MANSDPTDRHWTRGKLPWLAGAGFLALYLATLNHWVTLGSAGSASRILGWDWWSPLVDKPLLHLLGLPFRLFPASSQLTALNALNALFASATIALLVRSVALLPHDRTREQRQRERSDAALLTAPGSWMPPLLAAAVCGLQLTFWENAIAATGEMLDLLILAYVIRCLLEHRVDGRASWLYKLSAACGIGAANNWAIIGFLPCIAASLVWMKGAGLLRWRLLFPLFGFFCAGLLLYLYLPAIASADPNSGGFLQVLRFEIGGQKNQILFFPKGRVILLSLTTLVPVILMGVRWASTGGDTSALGDWLGSVAFHLAHLVFLGAAIWVAFDPAFSPRALGYGLPFLPFYYLGALVIGYYSGYVLLVFGPFEGKAWERPKGIRRMVNYVLTAVVWIGAIAAPAGLMARNLPRIRSNDSAVLRGYAHRLASAIPVSESALVLSDDPTHLNLLFADRNGRMGGNVALDTRFFGVPSYHRRLHERFSSQWPALTRAADSAKAVGAIEVAGLVTLLAQTNRVYYLHPPFGGLVLEDLQAVPRGVVYELRPFSTNSVLPSPPGAEDIQFNESFWASAAPAYPEVLRALEQRQTDAPLVGGSYSVGLNAWGVELQKLGKWAEAAGFFAKAIELSSNNAAAPINLEFNAGRRAGNPPVAKVSKSIEDQLGRLPSWAALMTVHGPLDQPEYCQAIGESFLQSGLLRQAIAQFDRARALRPDFLQPRLSLGEGYLRARNPVEALKVAGQIRSEPVFAALLASNPAPVLRIEATAHLREGKLDTAERLLLAARAKAPRDPAILEVVADFYLAAARHSQAVEAIGKLLEESPKHLAGLVSLGWLQIQMKEYEKALAPLDKALLLHPGHPGALLHRALAYFRLGRLDEAARDYRMVVEATPQSASAHFGLGEIAHAQKRDKEAVEHYDEGLKYLPAGHPDAQAARAKLKEFNPAR